MCAAFEKATITIRAERLHDANVHVWVEVAQEGFAIYGDEIRERAKIIVEKVLAEFGREIGFGVVKKRSDVVLQRAFAAALIVDEIRLAVAEHDVARLKIAVEEIIARGAEKKFDQAIEVVFKSVFVEGDTRKAK